jgi:hypothetical protein
LARISEVLWRKAMRRYVQVKPLIELGNAADMKRYEEQ